MLLVYNNVRLCRTDGSLRLTEIRGSLLRILLGADALPEQILRPYTLLASKGPCCLRLDHLLLVLFYRPVASDMGIEISYASWPTCAFAWRDRRLAVPIIDASQHTTTVDQLIIGHRQVDDFAIDLRTDGYRPCIDERVVGRYEIATLRHQNTPAAIATSKAKAPKIVA